MSEFNIAVMTEQGTELLAKAIAGKAKLKFTNMAVGSGEYKENEKTKEALAKITALKKQRQLAPFSLIERLDDNSVKLKAIIANDTITQGYYINEIGIYATDENKNEEPILYSIALDSFADYLPEYNGSSPATITEEYFVSINNSAEATILANAGAYAAAEDLERTIDGVAFTGTDKIVHYAECSTVGNDSEKKVSIPGFITPDWENPHKMVGARLSIKFKYTDTSGGAYLSINNEESRPITYKDEYPSCQFIKAGCIYDFIFTGWTWESTFAGVPFLEDSSNSLSLGSGALNLTSATGAGNTAIGYNALHSPGSYYIDSNENTAIGSEAMGGVSSTAGPGNTAVGSGTMYKSNGDYNTAIGHVSLYNNSGSFNIAVGYAALYSNKSGGTNAALGNEALYFNTDGYDNNALGYMAMYRNTTGAVNTAVGSNALHSNTTASNNTAIGSCALIDNTTGSCNTAIGSGVLSCNVTGSNNTAIGYSAGNYTWGNSSMNSSYSNITCLGYQAYASGNNQVQLGGSGTTVYGASAYTSRSDKRDKADIQDLSYDALDFITSLRPVNYRIDQREDYIIDEEISVKEYEKLSKQEQLKCRENKDKDDKIKSYNYLHMTERDGTKKRNRFHNGFIAQEVKEVADKLEFDFAGWQDCSHNGGGDVQSLAYEEFIAPIVASIQALAKENQELKKEKTKNEQVAKGVQALLRDNIISKCNEFQNRSTCPISVKENLKEMYMIYKNLGGNDVAATLYNKIMEMPEED